MSRASVCTHTHTPAHFFARIRTIDHLRASTQEHERMWGGGAYIPTPCPRPHPFSARDVPEPLPPRRYGWTAAACLNNAKARALAFVNKRRKEFVPGASGTLNIFKFGSLGSTWAWLYPKHLHRPFDGASRCCPPSSRKWSQGLEGTGDESNGKGPNNHRRAETPETPIMLWSASMAYSFDTASEQRTMIRRE